ncbi:MAG: hypothetical protein GX577_04290 [Leptolinea sp.]|nr:hypothetical protein [Leptolinea sp.]
MRSTLYEFYGTLNEIAKGLKPEVVIEKPEALVLYEQIKSTGVLLCAGGLLEQPWIFMMEYAVCSEVDAVFATLRNRNAKPPNEIQKEGS